MDTPRRKARRTQGENEHLPARKGSLRTLP